MLTDIQKPKQGWSGLWVSANGERMLAVEGGDWMGGRLSYDAQGNLAGFRETSSGLLKGADGKPLAEKLDQDAEALAFDGRRFLVGFEGRTRVDAYRTLTDKAQPIALPPEALANIRPDTGFSSVAALPGGGFLALPEYAAETAQAPQGRVWYVSSKTRAWLSTPAGSGPVWLRASAWWMPVDLTSLPNGDLLLVELKLPSPVTDVRVSRIRAADVKVGATMEAEELAYFAPPMAGTRIEGAAARKGRHGETLVYLITGEGPAALYMFELPEAPAASEAR
jgi:hypothetical protein